MKIQTLLELIQTKQDHRKSDNSFKDDRADSHRINRVSNTKDEKTGFYGRVYDKEQPHTLTKANYVSEYPQNDPYLLYIKAVVENKLAEGNPYFPRVYEIRTIEDSRGRVKYKIELERLHRLDEIDNAVLTGLTTALFDDDQIYTASRHVLNDPKNILARCVQGVCQQHIESKDNLLNEAGELVNKLTKGNPRFWHDVHKGNIMIRLSPSPQVVIVDPISQDSTSG